MTKDQFIRLFSSENFVVPLSRVSPQLREALVTILINRLYDSGEMTDRGDDAEQERIDATVRDLLQDLDI